MVQQPRAVCSTLRLMLHSRGPPGELPRNRSAVPRGIGKGRALGCAFAPTVHAMSPQPEAHGLPEEAMAFIHLRLLAAQPSYAWKRSVASLAAVTWSC